MVLKLNNQGIITNSSQMCKKLVMEPTEKARELRKRDKITFNRNMMAFSNEFERNLRLGMKLLAKKLDDFVPYSIMQYREYDTKDIENMLNRGHLLYGERAKQLIGIPGKCHRNSCELWELNHKEHDIHIQTGYALSKDGLWYQHSWLIMYHKDRKIEVIETTPVRRVAYYGYTLTKEEAIKFCSYHI